MDIDIYNYKHGAQACPLRHGKFVLNMSPSYMNVSFYTTHAHPPLLYFIAFYIESEFALILVSTAYTGLSFQCENVRRSSR